MRVIAGTARRLKLKTIEGLDTRPTTDRVKETLFNMLTPCIPGCRFLDLFAGSGGIGIEALSRGAAEAVFVEKNPKAMACIRENLTHTRLGERAETVLADVTDALCRLEGRRTFDYIFMDPPYDQGWERRVLGQLSESELLADEGIMIVEASKDTEFGYMYDLGFEISREKIYKTNKHVFLERYGRKEIC